jgi:hypothetical protein
MPRNIKQLKGQIKSKINTVVRLNDSPISKIDSYLDKGSSDLPSMKGMSGKKLSDLNTKAKKKVENVTNVFEDLVDLAESFIGLNNKVEPSNKLFDKQKLKQYAQESIKETLKSSKQIISDVSRQSLFAGDGICGSDRPFSGTVEVSPKEFDFMNVLTVDPTSTNGQIVYEPQTPDNGLIKMNRVLYDGFLANQTVTGTNGTDLCVLDWDESNQKYIVSGLTGNIGDFMSSYYSSIEHVDITGVTKTAMSMTLNADPNSPPLFDQGMNDLNRLLGKILKACGKPKGTLDQNSPQFDENEEDPDVYFDFDDLEGVDLDEEDRRYRKILRFVDCNNLEVSSNPYHFEDFVYMAQNDNLEDAINDALHKTALTSHEDSGTDIGLEGFHISMLNSFIVNLPKAMLGAILSPKYMFPIIVAYKAAVSQVDSSIQTAKQFMRKLSKMFNEIIKQHFWKFIQEFWSRIKKDLLDLLQKMALTIILKMNKKYLFIIAALIALLTLILSLSDVGDCNSLYELINKTIDIALSGGIGSLSPPGFLLSLATLRSGFSEDRALMNYTQNLEAAGISTAPIFGIPNNLIPLGKAAIDGVAKEDNANSKIMSGNLPTILAGPSGPIPLLPGQIKFAGVKF